MSGTLHARKAKKARRTVQRFAQPQQDDEQLQILAARLRVTTDSKLDKETPKWVKELAAKPL